MKKFFSLIALVGVFAACNPEDMTTAFQVAPAEVRLEATAVCAAPGFSGASINYSPSQTVTGNPVLAAGSITATATYNGASGSSTVDYPAILAGGSAILNTVVFIPYTPGDTDYEFKVEEVAEDEVVVNQLPAAAHGEGVAYTYTYDGKDYEVNLLENANEFVLLDSYTYTEYSGVKFVSSEITNDDFKDTAEQMINAYKAGMTGITETPVTKDFQVSAWAVYNIFNPVKTTTTNCKIVATPKAGANTPTLINDGVIATFKYETKASIVEPFEMAHPDHASHYEAGHGHGHGAGSNAGGGLVEAE